MAKFLLINVTRKIYMPYNRQWYECELAGAGKQKLCEMVFSHTNTVAWYSGQPVEISLMLVVALLNCRFEWISWNGCDNLLNGYMRVCLCGMRAGWLYCLVICCFGFIIIEWSFQSFSMKLLNLFDLCLGRQTKTQPKNLFENRVRQRE